MNNFFTKKINLSSGTILLQAFVFGSISIIIIGALVSWAGVNIKASRTGLYREQALQIAEAGIDYYRWHLAHSPNDYTDGTNLPGPYIHDFFDKDGIKIGTFTLEITPPNIGFTNVKIKSTGRVITDPNIYRSIFVQLAIPSLAKYATVANDFMRFGEGTEVFGPIHSNGGIRFDGLAHNVISSSLSSFDDPDHSGGVEFGVHTHVLSSGVISDLFRSLEAPPNPVQNRTDVFEAGRLFPVPAIDFAGLTSDLAQMKSDAQSNGRYFPNSGSFGYHVVFKTDDTFDVYKVIRLTTDYDCSGTATGWGIWSIRSSGGQTFLGNYQMPSNGIIFIEDNVWVNGQIQTARVTLAAGKFPDNVSSRPSIIINNDLLYSSYDGSDVLSLISQGNINVGLYSEDNLRIDAALVSQNGRVGRFYYDNDCGSNYIRDTITLYGMIASNLRYGFAYTDGTGYETRNIIYDANLLYGPPPSFPLTADQYQIISWEEVR